MWCIFFYFWFYLFIKGIGNFENNVFLEKFIYEKILRFFVLIGGLGFLREDDR